MSPQTILAADLDSLPWIEVINPGARLGRVRHALFDFDGTISVIRRGWEQIMIPLMVEMICDLHPSTADIENEVAAYVDRSTGILTIKQMAWLEEAVHRYGLARNPRTAAEYKRIYNERLLHPVSKRLEDMDGSEAARDTLMIAGVRAFLSDLAIRGVTMYLASGTDHIYVEAEARALDVAHFFGPHIYGAREDTEAYSKERIIQYILEENALEGDELLVVGDGPVEIRHAVARNALALGVAADEDQRQGLDPHKRQRLLTAGADLIVTDFTHSAELVALLCG